MMAIPRYGTLRAVKMIELRLKHAAADDRDNDERTTETAKQRAMKIYVT